MVFGFWFLGWFFYFDGMIGLGWFVKYKDQFKSIKNRSWANVCLLNSYAQLKIGLKLVIRVGWVGFVLVWFCFSFGFWVRLGRVGFGFVLFWFWFLG